MDATQVAGALRPCLAHDSNSKNSHRVHDRTSESSPAGKYEPPAQLQLKLQQTVEGLSLVVLTYYSVGLVQYLAKGAKALGYSVPIDIVTAFAVPTIAIGLLLALRQARKRFAVD